MNCDPLSVASPGSQPRGGAGFQPGANERLLDDARKCAAIGYGIKPIPTRGSDRLNVVVHTDEEQTRWLVEGLQLLVAWQE